MKACIIGCGGVGSWLAASMVKLIGPDKVVLIDGDTLERKNLDRQLFSESDIGRNKAEALAELYKCGHQPHWYTSSLMEHDPSDWLIGAVDNWPARSSIISMCDYHGCSAIFGANEVHSAEAYLYHSEWKATPRDPRTYYKEFTEVTTGDPRAQAVGCTGEAQEANRQLVTANFMAAALIQHLFVAHAIEGEKLDETGRAHLPFKLTSTLSRLESHKFKP